MRKLRVAQVCPYFYPVVGGVESHVMNLSAELKKMGHKVHVFTCDRDLESRRVQPCRETINGIEVTRVTTLAKLGNFSTFWPGIILELLAKDFDIVHTHVYRHPHSDMSLAASKIQAHPCILTTHAPFHPSSVRAGLTRFAVKTYDNSLSKIILPQYDAIICVSTHDAREIERRGVSPSKISIIPNGIREESFSEVSAELFVSKYGLQPGGYGLYLGRLHPTKGLGLLIRAFKQVVRQVPHARLVLAGKGEEDYLRQLEALSGSLGIGRNLTFTGYLTDTWKVQALAGSLFVVLPSVYEPFGIALLEAMAQKKPVITTAAGGPIDFIENGVTGFTVASDDEDGLERAMTSLFLNRYLAASMGTKGHMVARRFLWSTIAADIYNVYKSALVG